MRAKPNDLIAAATGIVAVHARPAATARPDLAGMAAGLAAIAAAHHGRTVPPHGPKAGNGPAFVRGTGRILAASIRASAATRCRSRRLTLASGPRKRVSNRWRVKSR